MKDYLEINEEDSKYLNIKETIKFLKDSREEKPKEFDKEIQKFIISWLFYWF